MSITRLITLVCDRALLPGFSAHARRISPGMVIEAAQSFDMPSPQRPRFTCAGRRRPLLASAARVRLAAASAAGAST